MRRGSVPVYSSFFNHIGKTFPKNEWHRQWLLHDELPQERSKVTKIRRELYQVVDQISGESFSLSSILLDHSDGLRACWPISKIDRRGSPDTFEHDKVRLLHDHTPHHVVKLSRQKIAELG